MPQNDNKLNIITNHLDDTELRWFAVYTKYKCEKYVSKALLQKNITAYVPLLQKTKRYASKIKHMQVPLINCYVFVRIRKADYVPILETEYVIKFLKQGKDLLSVPEHEIEIIKRVAGDVEEVMLLDTSNNVIGEEVEVVSGQLTGLRGRIVNTAGKRSFAVEIQSIGYKLIINIDHSLLKPLENHKI